MMIDDRRIDRLSALPDDVLHHILSFIDTKSSVQTSILSRRWTSVWKYVHVLAFDVSADQSMEQFVDRVLSLRSGSSKVGRIAVRSATMDLLDRIAKYAASHGVRELLISPPSYNFRDVFGLVHACHHSLKVLHLVATMFPDAHDHQFWSCLQMLESLTLTSCCLSSGDVAFGNLPRLESLKLFACVSYYYQRESVLPKVTGPELLNLEIVAPATVDFEIVAPKLQSFTLKIGQLRGMKRVFKSKLPFLNRANIKLFGYMNLFCDGTYSSDNDAKKKRVLRWCVNLFKILYNVRVLNLEVETFEWLIQICNSDKYQSCSPFKRMKSLNLKCAENFPDDARHQVVRYFFGGSPNEEEKSFTVEN